MGKRAWQYPEATGITNDDVILLDSPTGGSRSIKANKIGSVLINKTLTERGTFDATDDNVDGYKKVTVDVPYTDVEVASGPVASWDDGEDLPLKSLTSFIEPIQEGSGDPSPTNIRPIIGWDEVNMSVSGVNVWNEEWRNGYYNNGVFIYASDVVCCKNKIPIKPNTTLYYVKNFDINTNFYYTFYDKNGDFLRVSGYDSSGRIAKSSSGAISVPSGAYFMTFNMGGGYGTTYNNDISINYPSTDTSYHAYNGQTYTIDLDGTRYGGKLDVVSGVLTVDRVGIKGVNVARVGQTGSEVHYADTTHIYADLVRNTTTISDRYVQINTSQDGESGKFRAYDGEFTIYDDRFTDVATAQSLLNDVEFCYELATPITYQLTPTAVKSLLGTNNVWADTGDVDVEYQKIWVRPSA